MVSILTLFLYSLSQLQPLQSRCFLSTLLVFYLLLTFIGTNLLSSYEVTLKLLQLVHKVALFLYQVLKRLSNFVVFLDLVSKCLFDNAQNFTIG